MSENLVFDVREASFAYDDKQLALDRVSMSLASGECLALLGANGSGKSTLLKLLDGLYFASTGGILAFGQWLTEKAFREESFNSSFRQRVGLVFQNTDVQLFSPTVWEEVAFAALQLGLSKDETMERVEAALQALRIEKLRDRPPHRLSGGEKRRVAIASVLSLEPEVWLLDEPTAELDPRSQAWLVDFICEQRRKGKSVITATHDLSFVEEIADRVCVFDENHHVVAQGAPSEILMNQELLAGCNLIHAHQHSHDKDKFSHRHPHLHYPLHGHDHADE